MEEDGGVKAAPVTRLRRRLSVETDESKSPSAPSTPTKKRVTRLAAKPQLELIDEHAITSSPKRTTRKSISRDITKPEDKPVTPARRSTRTKSNTSLVSEADEKPLTPARRSTRIKSNTSIVSETAQSVESPRAKRATRRNSQLGSDTEAPVTPARTRHARKTSTSSVDIDGTPSVSKTTVTPGRTRTRKGSTSSIDTTAEAVQADKPLLITEVIAKEPVGKPRKSTSTDTSNANENKDDSPIRKSPRLIVKKGRKSISEDANETPKQSQENIEETDNLLISTEEPNKEINATEVTSQHNISMYSANLIEDLDTKLKKKISYKNKSMSDVEPTTESKKRDRTKSWTTLCASPSVESNFYSDNESSKKKLKKHGKIFNDKILSSPKDTGSGDGPKQFTAEQNNDEEKEQSFNTSKNYKKGRNNSISKKSASLENSIFEATKEVDISNESNKENLGVAPVVKDLSVAELLFETAPSADIKSMVFIEDSDSNTGSVVKHDQCVPIVLHKSENKVDSFEKQGSSAQTNIFALNNTNNKVTNDDSVEPMDIDETIPENVSLTVFTDEGKESPKSSQPILQETGDLSADTLNKSKRKSSVSNSISHFFDNSNSKDTSKQPCKSSLSVTLEDENNANRTSMRKSISEDIKNYDILANEQNVSMTESKKSTKSLESAEPSNEIREPDNGLADIIDKSKRKSTTSLPDSTSKHNVKVCDASMAKSKNRKQIRKSSLTVALGPNNSLTDDLDKSKRDSTSCAEDNEKEEIENKGFTTKEQDVSVNKSKKSKKSRKFLVAQESYNDLDDNNDKSKRKSTLSNSFSQDKNYIDLAQSNKEVIIEECVQIKSSRKSSISMAQDADDSSKNYKNSKRKANESNSMSHEKNGNESKSTLVLSQLKDISAAENKVSMSPRNELSKSMNIDGANKDAPVNKKLALNYLTSTPVPQKDIEKLAIQMNTSVITPTNTSKKCINTSKEKCSMVLDSSENNSSDEGVQDSDEDEESLQGEGNLFDDQAEDAGDDYESGDSQDDEERNYEKENEIVETGESLISEEDMSSDSDYEKDSFIVSSDEEDNELLSGSENDLDMSDNELTLSAKSKKKYNERKLKEQKKASREMFEARHGLNESDKNLKSNKSNRSRLDSTLLKSDEDVMPPKKNKRMRLESIIESSQVKSDIEDAKSNKDISTASDEDELGYKKKKSERLSESVCHENTMNENEITICNQSTTEKKDPLLQIKTEPKTPVKDLEISRVHVTDDVEQVIVDENMSILKFNETSDPLQATAPQEDDSDDYDSSSENEEIANNYDSVLRELNKEKKQIQSHDSNNKAKKAKEPTVDKLNLTQTNISQKDTHFQAKEKSVKRVFKKLADSDESSESIDLHLLFSDDSDDRNKNSEEEVKESIMPLKKSEAKTDIRRSMDLKQADCLLNTSSKKNKKIGAFNKTITDEAKYDGSLNFFIDTKGDLSDKATTGDDAANESESEEAPVEVLYVSNKNNKTSTSKRKKKKVSESEEPNPLEASVTDSKTLASGKKKKLESQDSSDKTPILKLVSGKKNKLSISHDDKVAALPKTPVSEKKKVKEIAEQKRIVTDEVTASNAKKRKRKSSANKTIDDIESEVTEVLNTSQQLNESGGFGNKNKKVKISTSIDDRIETNITETEKPVMEQNNSKKTKKNKCFVNKELTVDEPYTKKRKERDEEEVEKISKVFKENSFDKVHVPRLPPGVIDQLEKMQWNLPKREVPEIRKAKIVSTSNFVVEETLKRRNKPSDFLEETVYLNDDDNDAVVKKKSNIKKPKVLPFLPTVSTSDSGFTTNFHVNVISQKMEFVARNNEVPNFKNDYLNNKRIKKLRTYELYKKQRNTKLTKY